MRIVVLLMCLSVASCTAAGADLIDKSGLRIAPPPAEAQIPSGANLINNPGFENGTPPTGQGEITKATDWASNCGTVAADLFDSTVSTTSWPLCQVSVPNKWGSRAPHGGYRYVGIGTDVLDAYGASVTGTLALCLGAGTYTVDFFASMIDRNTVRPTRSLPSCSDPGDTDCKPSPFNIVQVVLRKGADCTMEKVVYSTPSSVTIKAWTHYQGTFLLTGADAALGYNRIEFRLTRATSVWPHYYHDVYLDDVQLACSSRSSASAEFTLVVPYYTSLPSFTCIATPVAINACALCYWRVCEIAAGGTEVDCLGGGWCAGSTVGAPLTFPLLLLYVPPDFYVYKTLYKGHTYRITHYVMDSCSGGWVSSSKTVFVSTAYNAPATITDDDSYEAPDPPSPQSP